MLRIPFAAAALLMCSICFAGPAQRPTTYDQMIARAAEIHGVPEAFVHLIVRRESRYYPRLVHNRCFGLMQIKYATARGMGYRGDAWPSRPPNQPDVRRPLSRQCLSARGRQ